MVNGTTRTTSALPSFSKTLAFRGRHGIKGSPRRFKT
jgi:hypothetical protein